MAPNNGINGGSYSPPATFMEKVERLSDALFPRWTDVCELRNRIASMQAHRVELLKTEVSASPPFGDIY